MTPPAQPLKPGDAVRTDDGRDGTVRTLTRFFDLSGEDPARSVAVISVGGIAVVKSLSQIQGAPR
jgi:hypothetical protein